MYSRRLPTDSTGRIHRKQKKGHPKVAFQNTHLFSYQPNWFMVVVSYRQPFRALRQESCLYGCRDVGASLSGALTQGDDPDAVPALNAL